MATLFKVVSVVGVLVAAVLALNPAPVKAQQGVDKGCSPTVANPCSTGGGDSSSGYASVFGNRPFIDDLMSLFGGSDKAPSSSNPGLDANEQGVVAYNNGDWAGAVALFHNAVAQNPDNQTFQKNLANAKQQLSDAQAEQESAQRNRIAADNIQRTIQSFAGTVGSAPAAGGLDFDAGTSGATANAGGGLDFSSAVAVAGPTPFASRSGEGLPKDQEDAIAGAYRDAPPGVIERVRKGFQAVATRDWKVATAWFQDALSRDPNNVGLKRMIALSQYTLPAAATSTALQLPSDADVDLLFLPDTAPASAVTGRPPSPAEVDEYFNNLGKGGPYKPSKELQLYLNGMPRDDYNRMAKLPPPAAASTPAQAQRPGMPASYIPPGPQRDEFMTAVLMDEMTGAKPLPENEALIKAYQWDDMGRLMYRMAHEPPDPALGALMKNYLAQSQ